MNAIDLVEAEIGLEDNEERIPEMQEAPPSPQNRRLWVPVVVAERQARGSAASSANEAPCKSIGGAWILLQLLVSAQAHCPRPRAQGSLKAQTKRMLLLKEKQEKELIPLAK